VHAPRTRGDLPALGANERAEAALHLEAEIADDPSDLHKVWPVLDIGGRPSPVPRQVRRLGIEDEDLIAVADGRLGRSGSHLAGTLNHPVA
jgi:hypothetical protein